MKKELFPIQHISADSRYLELKKSFLASSLLDSVRSSDLSCPSLEFKTNNEILKLKKKHIDISKTCDSTAEENQGKWLRQILEYNFFNERKRNKL